jgi:hypothetical protein
METINLNGLSDLDRLISEQFNLPLHPYSTDLRAALELSIWTFENTEQPHFEIFYSGAAQPEQPFLASFEPDAWDSGETPPIAICKSALRYLKKIRVVGI